jgi:general secretion pathway protein G
MAMAGGFSLFELAVATIVALLLTGVLLLRLQVYQRDVELVAVGQLIGTLRTALSVESAQLSVAKMEHQLPLVIDENPMHLLVSPPSNYLGEYYAPEGNSLPRGSWYFDRSDKTLVYLISNGKTFGSEGVNLLKFKVEFPDFNLQVSKPSGGPQVVKGAVLREVTDHGAVNQNQNGR